MTETPKQCPFCGGTKLVLQMVIWPSYSEEEPDNKANLIEHQCSEDGCARSFWTA